MNKRAALGGPFFVYAAISRLGANILALLAILALKP